MYSLVVIAVMAIMGIVDSTCDQAYCSDIDDDCWAGTVNEPCSCYNSLTPIATGVSGMYAGTMYYEFTCCDFEHDYPCGDSAPTPGPTIPIEMECGGTYTGYLSAHEWKHWTFTNPSPQVVTFTNCNSDHDTQMYLDNEYEHDITSESTNYCLGDNCYDPDYCTSWGTETFTMDPLSAGNYTLWLGWSWSSASNEGNYEVNVFCESGIDEDSCNQMLCSNMNEDCWAGSYGNGINETTDGSTDLCTCSGGLDARETGESAWIWDEDAVSWLEYFEFECCNPGTGGAHRDGTCGHHEMDDDGCSQTKCTSPSNSSSGSDCYAGTRWEGCTCSDGWTAIETGNAGPGSHGHPNYEYTCCPSGGTTDGTCGEFVRHSDEDCHQLSCSDVNENCWAGMNPGDECTCHDGLRARETGESVEVWVDAVWDTLELFEFECCDFGTLGAYGDGTCGNHEVDDDGCTQTKCMNPRHTNGSSHCYGGTTWLGCFCEDGWNAVETGGWAYDDDWNIYLEYTCCPSGGTADGTCGDFNSACNQDSCSDLYEDCWAGFPHHGTWDQCTCDHGLEARETGRAADVWVEEIWDYVEMFEYQCCAVGTVDAHSDGTCGNYEVDSNGCTQTKCISHLTWFPNYDHSIAIDEWARASCWAGTPWMGCTCDDGWTAIETGISRITDDGEVYHEYTCCPSGGTTDGTCGEFVRSDEGACNQDSCDDFDSNCWAGYQIAPLSTIWDRCVCSDGLAARETGQSVIVNSGNNSVEMYEFECCAPGTGGTNTDGICGDYETDNNGCSQTKCTSPASTPGYDCYAGTEEEGCTCSDGWTAVETGNRATINGNALYEYTCCSSGGTTDGTCGDYAPTADPTESPSNLPTINPSDQPSNSPTISPSNSPSVSPSQFPTVSPSAEPTHSPTVSPTTSCRQTKCTSDAEDGGSDCYAGTRWEPCTCSDGWTAVETGNPGPGSHGHPNYEYTCCPSGGTTNGTCGDFVPHHSQDCNQDWCFDFEENCWAGTQAEDQCMCHYGWEARETGESVQVWDEDIANMVQLFEFECCEEGTRGAHRDGTCGNHETDDDGCTQTKCRSPDNIEGGHCWGGTRSSGCFCDDGWEAVETWRSMNGQDGQLYRDYTCCPIGSFGERSHGEGTTDGSCYDFNPSCNQDSCADMDEDCWAGFNNGGTWDECTCHDGLEARETGVSEWIWVENIANYVEVFEFQCCNPGTEGAHRDGTCGNHETDENGCTQTKCTSEAEDGEGGDCYAGTKWEGCTCSDGWTAVETGNAGPDVHGHATYEYTCCPSGGTPDGTCGDFVHRYSAHCNQDSCYSDEDSSDQDNGECFPWAGLNHEGTWAKCFCHNGLEARETGESVHIWDDEGELMFEAFEYECCDRGTGGAHSDGTCGDYQTDENGCSQTKCTSPANTPGGDCYAGTVREPCTCSDGWRAVETGRQLSFDENVFYEYTCCTSEGTTDGTCGDHVPTSDPTDSPSTINPSSEPTVSPPDDSADSFSDSSAAESDEGSNLGAIIIFAVFAVLCLGGVAYYCGKCQKRRERIPSKAVPMNPAQPVAIAEGMNPPQALQAHYSLKGVSAQSVGAEQQVLFVPPASLSVPGSVPQAGPQDVVQMVMGQNGQWVMMQQPQAVQQMQPRQGQALAPQRAPQQMQFVYRMQQGRGSNVASTDQAPSAPINAMQQFQYVQEERQSPYESGPSGGSGDDTTK